MSAAPRREGLGFVRLMMVLSSLAPLFLLWAVRGADQVLSDEVLLPLSLALIVLPTAVLFARERICIGRQDEITVTIGDYEDHRDHLLVYLFSMLIPLYQAEIKTPRDLGANGIAFCIIVFIFYHLRLTT